MANFTIYIEDISGLYENVALLSGLNDIITYGPIKSNSIIAYKSLEAGYITPALDYSYNLNVSRDAKIGNNLDVYNNLNVMNQGYINKLIVYNILNYQFQLIYNGNFSIYVYIDQYYNVYPAYVNNTTTVVNFLDPNTLNNGVDKNLFQSFVYIHNNSYAITSILNTNPNTIDATKLQSSPIRGQPIYGTIVNYIQMIMVFYNNPVIVYGVNPIGTNDVYYYDQLTNSLVTGKLDINNNIVNPSYGTPLNIQYQQIEKNIFNDISTTISNSNYAFYSDGNNMLNGTLNVENNASFQSNVYIKSTLNVSDNVKMFNGLNVSNNTSIKGKLSVTDNVSFFNGLNVTNNTSIKGKLSVTDNVSFFNGLNVTNNTAFNGQMTVIDNVSLFNGLNVSNNTAFKGQMTVTDNVSFFNGLNVSNNTSFKGQLSVTDNVSFFNGLNVSNNTSFKGKLSVTDNVSFFNGLNVTNNTSIKGKLSVTDNVSFFNGLNVTNNTSIKGKLSVTDNVSFFNGLNITNNTSIIGHLSVTENVSFFDGLNVTNNTSLNGNLYVETNSVFNGSSIFTKKIDANNGLNVTNGLFADKFNMNLDATFIGGIIECQVLRCPTITDVTGSSNFDQVGLLKIEDSINASTGLAVPGTALFSGTGTTTIVNSFIVDSPSIEIKGFGSTNGIEYRGRFNLSTTGTNNLLKYEGNSTLTGTATGPAIVVNQNDSLENNDIARFQYNTTNVFTIGKNGNTTIYGGLKVGYTPNILNTTFNTSSNATLDINGTCAVNQNILLSGNIISQSDRNIKTNIIPIEDCLEKINNMSGYRYNRIDLNDNRTHIGLIAQEIEEIFPELVTETNNIKGINYQGFIAVLLNCIKELNKKIESKK